MGLYLQCGPKLREVDRDAWFLEIANIAYFRVNWSSVEPQPGSDLDRFFDPIFDYWVRRMKCRVAFRVMSQNTSTRARFVTPEWVFRKGVPFVRHTSSYGVEQIDPVFWSPEYVDQSRELVRRLGRKLDGREGLEFVDIGQIGEWGEMHLGYHLQGRWTSEQLEQTGYSLEKYVSAYRRLIDAYREFFPRTQIFLNVGRYAEIVEYAGIRGIHFRHDGLKPEAPNPDVVGRFFQPWIRRGIKANYEFINSYSAAKAKGWDFHSAIRRGLDAQISYLNTNLFDVQALAEAPDSIRDELRLAARRVGFRFVLLRGRYPAVLSMSKTRTARLVMKQLWKNVGAAPCYESYAVELRVAGAGRKDAAKGLYYPSTPTTRWWPGSEVELDAAADLDRNVPPGSYTLDLRMVRPERPEERVLLGISGARGDGWYGLGEIRVEAGLDRAKVLLETGFEDGVGDFRPREGMDAQVDRTMTRSGKGSLRLTGRQKGEWSWATARISDPLLPGGRYRLSAWLRVGALTPPKAPSLKVGILDGDGKHVSNHYTGRYDLKSSVKWQELSVEFDAPLDASRGVVSVEKGALFDAEKAEIWLDDVRVELVRSP
jgi:hypothetical protein